MYPSSPLSQLHGQFFFPPLRRGAPRTNQLKASFNLLKNPFF